MYALISGRTSEPRDWATWRELNAPGARMIPIEKAPDGSRIARVMSRAWPKRAIVPFSTKRSYLPEAMLASAIIYGIAAFWVLSMAGRHVCDKPDVPMEEAEAAPVA